ncbi:MAG: SDR family oxidoreductase [Acetobacteraceae bacterium]|nr:SDR family oxidoreductase [Acetobacteraceae bacterium]
MDLGLAGKTALVVGGSTGIGRATAEILLREGARVTVASRGVDKLREAASALEGATGRAPEVATCDAGDPDQVAALMARFGQAPLHVLVSAFGGSVRGAFEALTDAQWLANYDFNLLGTVRVVRAALPLLRRAAGGARVVLLGATSGRQPTELQVASNVHKAGLLALTKTLSLELAPDGIGVNSVSPGRAMTPRAVARAEQMAVAEGVPVEAIHERVARDIPLRRYGTAEEVAAMVAFLASPASAYTTGQNVLVDGGLYRGV